MSYPALLEVFASLTAQVTLLVGVAAFAICRQKEQADADGPWAAVHTCILLLTAAALLLPHFRPAMMGHLLPAEKAVSALTYFDSVGKVVLWIWLSGFAAILVGIAGGIWRATSLLRYANRNEELTALANGFVSAGRIPNRKPEVRVSPLSVSPFCWQFHRPIVVVPDLILDIPQSQQAAVLKHELAHLTLRHPLHLFLQRLVEAIYWYHPLVWWSSRQAAAAREFRCDQHAIESRREVADYLRSLLTMIEAQVSPTARLPAGMGFLGNRSLLQRRANALAEFAGRPRVPGYRRLGGAILSAVAVGVLVWLPVNPQASLRAMWSPWPRWSARALDASGIAVRDYEVDGHRLLVREHRFHRADRPDGKESD